jgi:hypothetical protein
MIRPDPGGLVKNHGSVRVGARARDKRKCLSGKPDSSLLTALPGDPDGLAD